jgi:hypothetical protein
MEDFPSNMQLKYRIFVGFIASVFIVSCGRYVGRPLYRYTWLALASTVILHFIAPRTITYISSLDLFDPIEVIMRGSTVIFCWSSPAQ